MILWFICLGIIAGARATIWDNLTATIAVVEFHRYNNETVAAISQNLLQYEDILFTLSKTAKLDMIIFPEGSVRTNPNHSVKLSVGDNPCNKEENYPYFFVQLSCIAQKYKTYLVTNVVERVKCENRFTSENAHCKKFGFYYYNTDVVFDRTGKFAYRYRKYNLFGEFELDRPEKPETVTFTTDFGVKFGIFTCFDLLFKNPANAIFSQKIDGIIYQSNWYSELPFLTSLQGQQMFAYAHDVMLFAAGGNRFEEVSGGSGIYKGANSTFATALESPGGTHVLTYRSVKGTVNKIVPRPVDELGKEMDAFPLMTDFSLQKYQWKPVNLSQHQIQDQVCYGNDSKKFCCNFSMNLTMRRSDGIFYSYLMVAFSGTRKTETIEAAGLEVCAVIACLNSSLTSCGRRFPKYQSIDWPITFDALSIQGEYEINEDKIQFPNSLLSSIRPIDASETDWVHQLFKRDGKNMVTRRFSLRKAQNRLLTFAIYGRNFAQDVALRDKNENPAKQTSGKNPVISNNNKINKNDNSGSSLKDTLLLLYISLCMTLMLKF